MSSIPEETRVAIVELLCAEKVSLSEFNIARLYQVVGELRDARMKVPTTLAAPHKDYTVATSTVGSLPMWRVNHDVHFNELHYSALKMEKYNGRATVQLTVKKACFMILTTVTITYERKIEHGAMTVSNVTASSTLEVFGRTATPLQKLLRAIIAHYRLYTIVGRLTYEEYDIDRELGTHVAYTAKRARAE